MLSKYVTYDKTYHRYIITPEGLAEALGLEGDSVVRIYLEYGVWHLVTAQKSEKKNS